MLATRVSDTLFLTLPQANTSTGCLVQIYPVKPLDRPFELKQPIVTVGRDECCELRLDLDSISRRHATISKTDGKIQICDLNSTNGTFVNDARIAAPTELRSGDRIRLGNQIFKFLDSNAIESEYHEVVFKLMTTDGLTQVYNKRFLLDSLEREIQQSRRGRQPMCVMMMDLDKFKSINDQYGHLAGDAVLVEFAKRASSVLRSGELFARYGGEEFSMLCAPATLEEGVAAAERVRTIVASAPVHFESDAIPMSVSIGIAAYDGSKDVSSETLLQEADNQLYRAKNNGRNQVQFRSSIS